jgi:high affinity Mn2+ porin
MKKLALLPLIGFSILNAQAQDSLKTEKIGFHAQATVIWQYKPGFSAPYTGRNSLQTREEQGTSVTSTLFAGARLWKNAEFYINPELAGGEGISQVLGVADATNGETFRVGDPKPVIYLGRMFLRQRFALTDKTVYEESDANQLAGFAPEKYIQVLVGKICLADEFDRNAYSHDPRTQFMNWGLMSNGAWDYPANTRGYVPSVVAGYISPTDEIRLGFSLLPEEANGLRMDWTVSKSNSWTLEYARHYKWAGRNGAVRLLGFMTNGKMGDYRDAIALAPASPVIENVQAYGHRKYGFALNVEQQLTPDLGAFLRAGWNDGNTQTWAFTEIDRSISYGLSAKGSRWHRPNDTVGLAAVVSGISKPHRDYLAAGGYGFMLGDGKLDYAPETVTEFYYDAELISNQLYLAGGYQFIRNPGYNHDRDGLANVFSVRLHASI